MKRHSIIGLGAGLLLGAAVIGGVALINDGSLWQSTTANTDSAMTMDSMTTELAQLKGDEFDKRFIELMIEHHDGAIKMAALADERSAHDEIKQLSRSITAAQTVEVTQMRQWQQQWGFVDPMAGMNHMSH